MKKENAKKAVGKVAKAKIPVECAPLTKDANFDFKGSGESGYVILCRYYNSTCRCSNLRRWHSVIGRSGLPISLSWEKTGPIVFLTKKQAKAWLKENRARIENHDPKYYNYAKSWQPDVFVFRIAEAEFKWNLVFDDKEVGK